MKKTLWIIFIVLVFFAIILYLGNVCVVGDHIGALIRLSSSTCAKWFTIFWYCITVIFPVFILIGWGIVRGILTYKELNIDALIESEDERKISQLLKSLTEQSESSVSTLDKHNMRGRCDFLLNSGNRLEKQAFLKEYYGYCEADAKAATRMYAVFAAVSVVLSPKAAGDAIALLVWQCRIISTTLKIYGGRPGTMSVLKLYAKVLFHSFMAASIDEVFDQFAFDAMDIKMLSFLTQALAAVASCVRTASLTRFYIHHGINGDRKKALRESLSDVSNGIIDIIKSDELRSAWKKFLNCSLEVSNAVVKETGKFAISIIVPGKTAESTSVPEEQQFTKSNVQ